MLQSARVAEKEEKEKVTHTPFLASSTFVGSSNKEKPKRKRKRFTEQPEQRNNNQPYEISSISSIF